MKAIFFRILELVASFAVMLGLALLFAESVIRNS